MIQAPLHHKNSQRLIESFLFFGLEGFSSLPICQSHKFLKFAVAFFCGSYSSVPSSTSCSSTARGAAIPPPTMGNCMNRQQLLAVSKEGNAAPVDTPFKLPSPLPSWPSGGGFAKGSIDLGGGLEVRQVSTFAKVWAVQNGGQDGLGATFFNPAPIPDGFCALGSYAQANNRPLFGWVLVGRDNSSGGAGVAALAKPLDYTLIWSSESSGVKQDGDHGYFWLPVPPDGYKAVGVLVTGSSSKPSPDDVRCVRGDLTDQCESEASIWSAGGFSVSALRPVARGVEALGVRVGTFIAQADPPSPASLACLKNTSADRFSCMPNRGQIDAIMQAYSPWVYFHSDEGYLPSSVRWFFENGALLYQKGGQNPVPIASDGSNLPQGGSNDGAYWIDLPADSGQKARVKKGDLASAQSYLHVKPMLGATFTDVAIWLFYPFNGPARAKVKFIKVIKLGRIGEHVGDWEHVTLRVSNFSGELWRVYLSEHSGGAWTDASQLEFQGGNKPVAYSSLNGHAMYPRPGLVLQGSGGVGIRNDTNKGSSMDTGAMYEVAAAEYLSSTAAPVTEPAWLNFQREWGPKITYKAADELKKVIRFLPGKLKSALLKLVEGLPDEVLGQEGPTGPKAKSSWTMDEK